MNKHLPAGTPPSSPAAGGLPPAGGLAAAGGLPTAGAGVLEDEVVVVVLVVEGAAVAGAAAGAAGAAGMSATGSTTDSGIPYMNTYDDIFNIVKVTKSLQNNWL